MWRPPTCRWPRLVTPDDLLSNGYFLLWLPQLPMRARNTVSQVDYVAIGSLAGLVVTLRVRRVASRPGRNI